MDFISQAACKGVPPRLLDVSTLHPRPELINRLLGDRQVARFLIAPAGFGKTFLAYEYALTLFEFKNTFWFNAADPKFTRDLDSGNFMAELMKIDGTPALAVFDDVMQYDEDRSSKFSKLIDGLLAVNCEVIVCCTSFCDAYESLQRDRLVLVANDLCLSDFELQNNSYRLNKAFMNRSAKYILRVKRIAGLSWSDASDEQLIVDFVSKDSCSPEAKKMIVGMLLLGQGSLSALQSLGFYSSELVPVLIDEYPQFFIDVESDYFVAPGIEPPLLLTLLRDAFCVTLPIEKDLEKSGVSHMLLAASDVLCAAGNYARACKIINCISSCMVKFKWLAANELNVLRFCAIPESSALFYSLQNVSLAKSQLDYSFQALRYAFFDMYEQASILAQYVFKSHVANLPAKLMSYAVAYFCSLQDERLHHDLYESLLRAMPESLDEKFIKQHVRQSTSEEEFFIMVLGTVAFYTSKNQYLGQKALRLWQDFAPKQDSLKSQALMDAIMLSMLWFVDEAHFGAQEYYSTMYNYLIECTQTSYIGLFCYKRIAESAVQLSSSFLLPHLVEQRIADVRSAMDLQRSQLGLLPTCSCPHNFQNTKTSPARHGSQDKPYLVDVYEEIPQLSIKLFGRFEVEKNGAALDSAKISRQKIKTLLAFMAQNLGREVSVENLLNYMWPKYDAYCARRNLYTLWGLLRKALKNPDGNCPYLVKLPHGYKLDKRYVSTDIERFNELTRQFLVGRPDGNIWMSLLDEFNNIYVGDFLPCEQKNIDLLKIRKEYQVRATDALVAGAGRLCGIGRPGVACGFARSALRIDKYREDAYRALMQAQIDLDQLTAGLETFNECRHMLSEELGLSPSAKTYELYNKIIGGGKAVC